MRQLLHLLAIALVAVSCVFAQGHPCGVIQVPTTRDLISLSEQEERCLSIVLDDSVASAIERGIIYPGQVIDFSVPAIHFVYSWQLWVERRTALVKEFGPQVSQNVQDVQEIERWNDLKDAWKDLDRAVQRSRR